VLTRKSRTADASDSRTPTRFPSASRTKSRDQETARDKRERDELLMPYAGDVEQDPDRFVGLRHGPLLRLTRFELNVERYRRRTARASSTGPGRPTNVATPNNVGAAAGRQIAQDCQPPATLSTTRCVHHAARLPHKYV